MAEYWNEMYGSSNDDDDRSSSDEASGDNCAGRIILSIGLGILTGGLLG